MAKFEQSPNLMQALVTAVGTDLTPLLEQVGGVEKYSALNYISGPLRNVLIGYLARTLSKTIPNQCVEENEFVAIVDGIVRRVKEA